MTETPIVTQAGTVPPAGGWSWIDAAAALMRPTTKYAHDWDLRYEAACPCGKDVLWNAKTIEPLCDCPPLEPEQEER